MLLAAEQVDPVQSAAASLAVCTPVGSFHACEAMLWLTSLTNMKAKEESQKKDKPTPDHLSHAMGASSPRVFPLKVNLTFLPLHLKYFFVHLIAPE